MPFDLRSPPCFCGRRSPELPDSRAQRIALEGLMPNRSAAWRRVIPPSIASTTATKIKGKRLGHACRPPSPARSLNQIGADSRIPFDSVGWEIALDVVVCINSKRVLGKVLRRVPPGLLAPRFTVEYFLALISSWASASRSPTSDTSTSAELV